MVKQLSEKPFMEISQRQFLKKRIPMLEAQIKRLRLDLSTVEMLSNIRGGCGKSETGPALPAL